MNTSEVNVSGTKTFTVTETYSVASLVALAAAIASFFTGALLGFVLAGIAIVAGLFGVIIALSPAKRGGFVSVFALLAGALGIFAAVVKAILWVF